MSFPRAAIKRFNEPADTSIPPPGTYHPKFTTDLGVKLLEKAITPRGTTTTTTSKSISSSSRQQEDGLNEVVSGRVTSREGSLTRRRSTATTGGELPAEPINNVNRQQQQQQRRSSSISSSCFKQATRSSSKSSCRSRSRMLNKIGASSSAGPSTVVPLKPQPSSTNSNKLPAEITKTQPEQINEEEASFPVPSNSTAKQYLIIQEIEEMAENLQAEVTDYRKRLCEEIIRGNELEARRVELEFTVQGLQRELRKYEGEKEAWEGKVQGYKLRVEEFVEGKVRLEREVLGLRGEVEGLNAVNDELVGKVEEMEVKLRLRDDRGDDGELSSIVKSLQLALKDEESRRKKAEGKCKVLLSQMETCYHLCEARVSDGESVRRETEVKLRELGERKCELEREIVGMRKELGELGM